MEDINNKETCCYFCGSPMIWGGDNDASDYGLDGEGIVTNLHCSNEDCNADATFTLMFDKEDK